MKYAKPYSYVKGSILGWEGADGRENYNKNPKVPIQFQNDKFLVLREIARTTDISFSHVIRTCCDIILSDESLKKDLIEWLKEDRQGIDDRRTTPL